MGRVELRFTGGWLHDCVQLFSTHLDSRKSKSEPKGSPLDLQTVLKGRLAFYNPGAPNP